MIRDDLPVYIVSNLELPVPSKLQGKVFILPAKPEHAALGIGIKLYTDEYLQTEHTLFIDSDCLCYASLDKIFEACEGIDVSAAGRIVPANDWCSDDLAKTIKATWGLDELIRFNGGLYYYRRSDTTKSIFTKAREIAEKYDEYGFSRIKDKWMNEEVPLSISMALYGQRPIADEGNYMTDLFTDYRPKVLNVLTGARLLQNPALPSKQHRPWYPASYSPVVVHFGGSNLSSYPYLSQTWLLKFKDMGFAVWLSSLLVNVFIDAPFRFYYWLKRFK